MHWSDSSFFYHIYPLGFCGSRDTNRGGEPVSRLPMVADWIGNLEELGVTALYIGPLFESLTHGYDTIDYTTVDRRLGTNRDLRELVGALKGRGIRVVLDAVLNHVSREFFAFQDVIENQEESAYWDWFSGITREGATPMGDPFSYDTWDGHYELVKLNHRNDAVREHLFSAVTGWIEEFGIDGVRLDAADVIPEEFLQELRRRCRSVDKEFWLLGEMVHGDYTRLANEATLDSVTNYECYKGLYSSHNDGNYFEIAHSLRRQFEDPGIYRNLRLYNFADNHDVDRVASSLKEKSFLYPLYLILATMPGIPSVYYGSEWGIEGVGGKESDAPLRPTREEVEGRPERDETLFSLISRLSRLRAGSPALRLGAYKELLVEHELLVYLRQREEDQVIVAVNSSREEVALQLPLEQEGSLWEEQLNGSGRLQVEDGYLRCTVLPRWGNVLRRVG